MADQSVSFDSLLANLDAEIAEIAAAEKAAVKFLDAHKELDLQFRIKGNTASQEGILIRYAAELRALTPSVMAEVLRSLGADLRAVIGFLSVELCKRGVGRRTADSTRLLIAKVRAWGAPAMTLTDAVAAYAEIVAAA